MTYKGMMLEGVPNFAFAIGYTNASWTLKVDLASTYLCRLLAHMRDAAVPGAKPVNHDASVTQEPARLPSRARPALDARVPGPGPRPAQNAP